MSAYAAGTFADSWRSVQGVVKAVVKTAVKTVKKESSKDVRLCCRHLGGLLAVSKESSKDSKDSKEGSKDRKESIERL